jgi:ATP-dependent helicase/nuclease subunit A
MTRELADATARRLITGEDPAGLDQTLFVEAGAGSGKTGSLVRRVLALVAHGVELQHIAAITFTEKAAAELRDRIRVELERRVATEPAGALRDRFQRALDQVDMAALSTLHSFAQRLLTQYPVEAGLPPNMELLDEVSSEVEFQRRWRAHRDAILADDDLAEVVQLGLAAGMRFPDDVRQLALEFERNWDLATDPSRMPWDAGGVPSLDVTEFVRTLEAVADRRHECADPSDALYQTLECHAARLVDEFRAAPDDAARLRLLDPNLRRDVAGRDSPVSFKWKKGRKGNWPDGAKDEIAAVGADLIELRDRTRQQAVDALLHRLAVSVGRFVESAARDRVRQGRLEFHDLLVLARRLLQGPSGPEVRTALRARYQRLLLDEFQDTDPIQVELAVLLASGAPDAGGSAWLTTPTDPGRLFFVGDPKQSIYRFRRADIGLFLQARRVFADGRPVSLTTNFRTSPSVIGWVNDVFGQLIAHEDGAQPEYEALDPSPTREDPPGGPAVTVVGARLHEYEVGASTLREREATDVADVVVRAVADGWQVSEKDDADRDVWRDATYGDITILLPARTSLPMLEDALTARGIPYRAESSSLVYSTREVRDLLMTVRALADPSDQLALVAALRSHVFGCSDADLLTWRRGHRQALHLLAPVGDEAPDGHPVGEALTYLRGLHDDLPWLTPAQLLDRICRDRQLFEIGHATRRPRDVWRRLRFVIDQARAWSESEGGTIREYLAWARRQSSDSVRVAETILPETDDDSVRIMTIHAAKGLEFPITILSGTSTRPQGNQRGVQVVWPPDGPVGIRLNARVASQEFDAFQPLDEQMGHHERVRLLYVACTRARDHLVVSLHRKERRKPADSDARRTSAELLAEAADATDVHVWQPSDDEAPAPAPPHRPAPLARDAWLADRQRALRTAGWSRSVGATGVQELLASALDEGDEKDPRDLDLPAWRKGRYGSAIGRAVHGVLQTVDLATGDGLAQAAAAQAAAEGVVGREGDVEALARAALGSPVVQQAALAPERWRETFVAVPVGQRTLEGYIDLAFRSMEGLVVVDYKTASSAHDLDLRMDHYRGQGGAYALALHEATGEPVARVVFVFLTPDGAIERDLDDPMAAAAEVRAALEPVPA